MTSADNGFDKSHRLLSASDFSYLKKDAKYFNSKFFRIYYKKSQKNSSQSRLGISVTKKVGKAHDRNLCKRIVREVFRCSDYKQTGIDYMVLISPFFFKNSTDPRAELAQSLSFAFSKISL